MVEALPDTLAGHAGPKGEKCTLRTVGRAVRPRTRTARIEGARVIKCAGYQTNPLSDLRYTVPDSGYGWPIRQGS